MRSPWWRDVAGSAIRWAWERGVEYGSIASSDRRARRFGAFGERSVIMFPFGSLYNEQYIAIGAGTLVCAHVSLSAGMIPGQKMLSDTIVRIGDRCLIGRGSGIVGHLDVEIGNDVYTGHNVYITDQNHAYADVDVPIGRQSQPERPVVIGHGSWLGHGVVVLPGARVGRHVAVGANSVVTGELPDYCVAAGAPARVIKQYEPARLP